MSSRTHYPRGAKKALPAAAVGNMPVAQAVQKIEDKLPMAVKAQTPKAVIAAIVQKNPRKSSTKLAKTIKRNCTNGFNKNGTCARNRLNPSRCKYGFTETGRCKGRPRFKMGPYAPGSKRYDLIQARYSSKWHAGRGSCKYGASRSKRCRRRPCKNGMNADESCIRLKRTKSKPYFDPKLAL